MDRPPADKVLPSGQQHVIGHGRDELVVTEVGATMRSYSADGHTVLDGFAEAEMCNSGRGQVLAPWPNRLGDGTYSFSGRSARAPLDEPERGNAIHGLVRYLPWELKSRAQNVLVMGCVLFPSPAYPWKLSLEIEYRLGRDGLTITTDARNLDDAPAPFGLGFHPYLTVGTPSVDSARLRIPAGHYLRSDERGLPSGRQALSGSEFDYAVARPVGPTLLDTAFGDLARDGQGIARVSLHHPDSGRGVALWMDRSFTYVMAYTGDTVEEPERRRRAVALEPMTCPPDAFRSGLGVITLEPGRRWRGSWGISPAS